MQRGAQKKTHGEKQINLFLNTPLWGATLLAQASSRVKLQRNRHLNEQGKLSNELRARRAQATACDNRGSLKQVVDAQLFKSLESFIHPLHPFTTLLKIPSFF